MAGHSYSSDPKNTFFSLEDDETLLNGASSTPAYPSSSSGYSRNPFLIMIYWTWYEETRAVIT